MKNAKVVIALPAYNAAKTLLLTLKEIPSEFQENIILVDDASQDNTVSIAIEAGLKVFQHETNQGYGANQKTCYKEALALGADIIIMLHPDHQYDARVIPDLAFPILKGEADAVFGSRMLGGHPMEGGMPRYKYTANVGLTALANLIYGRYLTEIHSGFRAYSRKYLQTVRFYDNSDDFIFDTEIIAQGMACNLFFKEVAIETRYFPEASSINFRRSVVYGFGILYVLFRFALHKVGWWKNPKFFPQEKKATNDGRF
ncbi:MAG: glycosyltransferase family 2 protein [Anaerolineae bacterium]|jgi:glycosyltransferase involved in cell wall biosynthesis|nr:glycosyltransferase family 2 protein [Anaerolineae bacterium]MBT7071657.1 glycosyltransferase family 2 protein [Anaerolineae bacterium]MBT7323579.1 glycosyltransferase family 2 protein [Anaerolineae bacterium]